MAKRPNVFRPPARSTVSRSFAPVRLSPTERGYDHRWTEASKRFRRDHPFCQYCAVGAFGPKRTSGVTHVDHLFPQRRFPDVFWRDEWWVSCCDPCDAAKQALEANPLSDLDRLAALLGRPPRADTVPNRAGGGGSFF
jgi:5-methylcytosine-specific restriction protein A